MKRENLILTGSLRNAQSTGVLDTPEKMRQACEEFREATAEAFEEIRISRLKTLEESMRRVLG